MGKIRVGLWAIIFTLIIVTGCASTESSQTSVGSPNETTESQKKSEEVWLTTEVVTKDSKYSYKVPEESKPISKGFLNAMSTGANKTGGGEFVGKVNFTSGFTLKKGSRSEMPLVVSTIIEKDSEIFNSITEILSDFQALQKENLVVICENDKELVEAIQKQPYDTLIISKNKKAVLIKESFEMEKEKCAGLLGIYLGETSAAYLVFMEKESDFNKQLPLFVKVGETVTFAK
ncbi:hypothetical protein [Aneurinibacillus aneurinilyticus]|uniref:Uncharacterized protein n=2 Tax=Aneurinibacillus aneurinilyticus TaxID=1391 RepID=U1X2E6_ANEAE|nr:hypothetical protein [Aneurinibacillus aneurinilyticus]ERI09145.1 hypothetical protein HMPREF0083_02795 [Aneurinibacillus aneurinilyticus ATCC 12856]MED0707370.1 hypothetical protein [Aneurinibacillus aneurinilyticus]MED0724822.1 hypothetical protein [Aneurinibacillus aneurinilyticus]MED0733272.1 hypothetical protein [Aneurinibacillus aneurinilyticus]MED0742751.1 hypothetical protein [Aneurinibacillus aneurinilyticus]